MSNIICLTGNMSNYLSNFWWFYCVCKSISYESLDYMVYIYDLIIVTNTNVYINIYTVLTVLSIEYKA